MAVTVENRACSNHNGLLPLRASRQRHHKKHDCQFRQNLSHHAHPSCAADTTAGRPVSIEKTTKISVAKSARLASRSARRKWFSRLLENLVHHRNCDRSFSNRRSHAFHVARAYIA